MDLLHEEGDAIFDAIISSLLASALVWQFGLIENYSRGVSLLFLVSFITCLAVSRPLIRAHLRRLAARGAIEQRIAFYGADPEFDCLHQPGPDLARPAPPAVRRSCGRPAERQRHSGDEADRRL